MAFPLAAVGAGIARGVTRIAPRLGRRRGTVAAQRRRDQQRDAQAKVPQITVRAYGIQETEASLARLRAEIKGIDERAAKHIASDVRQEAPVRSGRLRRSIRAIGRLVQIRAPYAGSVDDRTSYVRRGIERGLRRWRIAKRRGR